LASPSDTSANYIGLMSGTSMDGVDAALVRFGNHRCDVLATHKEAYPEPLRADLKNATQHPETFTVDTLGLLDQLVAERFSSATLAVIANAAIDASQIEAIGSHGQTVRHRPHAERPFTLQIGDPNRIAAATGITTVADFRRRDLAAGGEGAPLAPAFHQWLFAEHHSNCVVLNIGGIANITVLADSTDDVIGFDTGPGNTLLDLWIGKKQSHAYDDQGEWAASGSVIQPLLQTMLDDPYFAEPPPKSTGFEYFNQRWLDDAIQKCGLSTTTLDNDIQATLAELTGRTIADAIRRHAPHTSTVMVCGGGVHNDHLMSRLKNNLPDIAVSSTGEFGLDPDWVEAAAFAWLAMRTIGKQPGNLPSVTGAKRSTVLGGIYFGTR